MYHEKSIEKFDSRRLLFYGASLMREGEREPLSLSLSRSHSSLDFGVSIFGLKLHTVSNFFLLIPILSGLFSLSSLRVYLRRVRSTLHSLVYHQFQYSSSSHVCFSQLPLSFDATHSHWPFYSFWLLKCVSERA